MRFGKKPVTAWNSFKQLNAASKNKSTGESPLAQYIIMLTLNTEFHQLSEKVWTDYIVRYLHDV